MELRKRLKEAMDTIRINWREVSDFLFVLAFIVAAMSAAIFS